MTEDIIEAVARVIWDSKILQPARGPWEANNNATEQCCREAAQAAITAYEAARGDVVVVPGEPTLEMLDAGHDELPLCHASPEDCRAILGGRTCHQGIGDAYRAMIAASQGER